MIYNHADIDNVVSILEREAHPALPYARYLRDWRDIVDAQSDGWPYWSGGHRAAAPLMELLHGLIGWNGVRAGAVMPSPAEWNRAIGRIRACATRRNLPKPVLDRSVQSTLFTR